MQLFNDLLQKTVDLSEYFFTFLIKFNLFQYYFFSYEMKTNMAARFLLLLLLLRAF